MTQKERAQVMAAIMTLRELLREDDRITVTIDGRQVRVHKSVIFGDWENTVIPAPEAP
jgi:cell division protein ZapA (FtsZ GTPase activity inhibitor)